MNYGQIIKSAWQATWRYRAMWILGMAVLGGCNGGSTLLNVAAEALPDTTATSDYETQLLQDAMLDMAEEYWILLLLVAVCVLLLIILTYVFHFIALGGMYQGAQAAGLQQPVQFGTMCKAGTKSFWRTIGVSLLIRLSVMIPLLFAFFTLIALAITVVGLVIAVPLLIILLISVLPLGWVVYSVYQLALQLIVLEQGAVLSSLTQAFQLWRANWKASIMIYLMNILNNGVVGVVTVLVSGLIALPLVIFGYFAYSSQAWLAIGLLILAGLLLILTVAFLLKGIAQSFSTHLWHRFYAEVTRPKSQSVVSL